MQKSKKILGATLGSVMLVGALAGTVSAPADAVGGAKVTITPSTNLKNGQTVKIKGSGFSPSVGVFLVECKDAKGKNCTTDTAHLKSTKSSASGKVSASYKVYTGTVCKAHKTCYIAVVQADQKKGQIKAIKFK